MHPDVLKYLATQRACVLAVEMPDGSPHAATVHFAHREEPLVFIFETDRKYRKSEALSDAPARASLVVGTNEGDMKTLQMDGDVQLLPVDDAELSEIYLKKFPQKQAKMQKPGAFYFIFTPHWWRFTDWAHPEGKRILSSEAQN